MSGRSPEPGRRVRGPGLSDLSERDCAVLADLAGVRLLTGRQLQRLHVRDGSPLTQARRTRALLQRLNDQGLVTRLERRIGGVSAGSAGFVYGLSAAGQRLMSTHGPAGGRRLRRPWEPGSSFTAHVLAVSELYVQLRQADADGSLELLSFEAEPACWRWWSGLGGERLVLKPDAFVALAAGDYELLSFVEVDLSTESSTVLRRKALTYLAHWQSGSEQQRHGLYPRVVWLVPDERRRDQLVQVLGKLPADAWQLFRVGLHSQALATLGVRGPANDERKEGDNK